MDAFEHLLKAAGGPYIGPRGGKWADAAHTIPWGEDKPKAKRKPKANPAKDAAIAKVSSASHGVREAMGSLYHYANKKADKTPDHAEVKAAVDSLVQSYIEAKAVRGAGTAAKKAAIAAIKPHLDQMRTHARSLATNKTVGYGEVGDAREVRDTLEEGIARINHHGKDKAKMAQRSASAAQKRVVKLAHDAKRKMAEADNPTMRGIHQREYLARAREHQDRFGEQLPGHADYLAGEAATKQKFIDEHGGPQLNAEQLKAAAQLPEVKAAKAKIIADHKAGKTTVDEGNAQFKRVLHQAHYSRARGQQELFRSQSKMDAFDNLLRESGALVKAGGPFIGPHGGKWADPKHTIPWKSDHATPAKAKKYARDTKNYAEAHDEHDKHMVDHMHMIADNDGDHHRRTVEPIRKNLINKLASGKYDHHEARNAWKYHAEATAKAMRARGEGNPTKHDIHQMAHESAERFLVGAKVGDHDHLLHKKHTKAHPTTGGQVPTQAATNAIAHGGGHILSTKTGNLISHAEIHRGKRSGKTGSKMSGKMMRAYARALKVAERAKELQPQPYQAGEQHGVDSTNHVAQGEAAVAGYWPNEPYAGAANAPPTQTNQVNGFETQVVPLQRGADQYSMDMRSEVPETQPLKLTTQQLVTLDRDVPVDPFALHKAQRAQQFRDLSKSYGGNEPTVIRPNLDPRCPIHGLADMTKSQMLQHGYGHTCTCPIH